jgi:hypothetical protein
MWPILPLNSLRSSNLAILAIHHGIRKGETYSGWFYTVQIWPILPLKLAGATIEASILIDLGWVDKSRRDVCYEIAEATDDKFVRKKREAMRKEAILIPE